MSSILTFNQGSSVFSVKKYPRVSVFTIVLSENGTFSYRTLQDFPPFLSLISFLPLLHVFFFCIILMCFIMAQLSCTLKLSVLSLLFASQAFFWSDKGPDLVIDCTWDAMSHTTDRLPLAYSAKELCENQNGSYGLLKAVCLVLTPTRCHFVC